jgi:outer membrane protein TolC
MKLSCRGALVLKYILSVVLFPSCLLAEPIPLKRIVELALSHATAAGVAAADQQRIQASYRELHSNYIPQLTTGAGLGFSYGFPLALEGQAPSLFAINAQSALVNPALQSFLQAARADSKMAALNTKDQRDAVIQEAAQSYAELSKWEERLAKWRQLESDAANFEAAVNQRVKEGVDSEIDGTKARLSAARVRLRIAEAQGAADVLREHLAKLTGLAAANIQTDPGSFPATPAPPAEDLNKDTAASTPGVEAAMEHARAQYLRAKGEHRGLWPAVDFAAQYALLSKFNNYQNYYIPSHPCTTPFGQVLCVSNAFQQNNATIGVNIRVPIFNATQRARAQGADAEALRASRQAQSIHDKVSEETLRSRRSVVQMQAAHDVAQLEYELAEKTLQATQTRIDAGTANLHDLEDARSQLSERFVSLQDVTFELQRAQLGLMRTTGDLEKWALGQ